MILQQSKEQVEMLLKTTDTLATLTVNDPRSINDYSIASVLELPNLFFYRKQFESMLHKLVQVQVYELGVHDVNLISFQQDWLVAKGVVNTFKPTPSGNELDKDIALLRQQFMDYRNDNRLSYWKKLAKTTDLENPYMMRLLKNVPFFSSNPSGMLSVNIPLAEIERRLKSSIIIPFIMVGRIWH
jgi:hypothetical protein